jgi:hypothetical protein
MTEITEIENWVYEIDSGLDLIFKNRRRLREYIDKELTHTHDAVSFQCLEEIIKVLKKYEILE